MTARFWTVGNEPERRLHRIDALAPDRTMHDKYQGEPLPEWSERAKACEQRPFAKVRENVTAQERIEAWRGLFKGNAAFVRQHLKKEDMA